MLRFTLRVLFIMTFLSGSQVFAEETNTDTAKEDLKEGDKQEPSPEPKKEDVERAGKDDNALKEEPSTSKSASSPPQTDDTNKNAADNVPSTAASDQNSDNRSDKPNINDSTQKIIQSLLDKAGSVSKGPESIVNRAQDLGPLNRPQSLFGLGAPIIDPAVQAKQNIRSGLAKAGRGLRDIGTGSFIASAGAFNYARDAASFLLTG